MLNKNNFRPPGLEIFQSRNPCKFNSFYIIEVVNYQNPQKTVPGLEHEISDMLDT